MTLTEFLLARIAEREKAINHAFESGLPFPVLSPAEMLAECEAKRRIIEAHDSERPGRCRSCGGFVSRTTPRGIEHSGYDIPYPCLTLRSLALPYADHPDYQAEWKP